MNNAIVTGQTNLDGLGGPELAPGPALGGANPVYIGTSLGAIVGDVFHATEPNLTASALNVGGARITNILLTSPAFSPPVIDGLAEAGIAQGTPSFAQFFLIAQAVTDDADPINYADQATSGALRGGTPAQILQQVHLVDNVVPPSTQFDLALQHANGSADFGQVDAIAVQQLVVSQVVSPFAGSGFFEVPNASHGSILDPTSFPAATVGLVTQALTYVGTALQTGTGTIIDAGLRTPPVAPQVVEAIDNSGDVSHAVRF